MGPLDRVEIFGMLHIPNISIGGSWVNDGCGGSSSQGELPTR
jgi:hypothetical protein